MNNIVGYISSSPIRGGVVSHRVQNIVIKEYARERNIQFDMSRTEFNLGKSHSSLNSLLSDNYNTILFYSLYMMPECPNLKEDIFNFIDSENEIHFCAENLILNTSNIDEFKKLINYKELIDKKGHNEYSLYVSKDSR